MLNIIDKFNIYLDEFTIILLNYNRILTKSFN